MNKNLIYSIIIVIIVLGTGSYFLINKDVKGGLMKNSSLHSENSVSTKTTIDLTTLERGVFLKSSSEASEVEVEKSASTSIGQVVKTGTKGRALLEWPLNHPTVLDYSSEVSIVATDNNGDKNSLQLISGEVWSRTKNSAEKGEDFEIKTGNAVAVVRGTSFGLSFFNNISVLIVKEGKVSIFKKDKKTGEAIAASELLVSANQKAIVSGDGDPKLIPLGAEDKMSPWFIYNNNEEGSGSISPLPGTPSASSSTPSSVPGTSASSKSKTGSSFTTSGGVGIPSLTGTNPGATRPSPSTGGGSYGSPTQVNSPKAGTLASQGSVVVRGIFPKSIISGDNQTYMIITGSGFKNITDLVVEENIPPDFEILSDTSVRFHIGKLAPGTYDMYFILSDASTVMMPGILQITAPQARQF